MGIVDIYSATESALVEGWNGVTHRRFEPVIADLLPRGAAWNRDGVVLQKLVAAQATELSRVDRRAQKLLRELDPAATFELITDWEEMLGLPDCAQPETLEARRKAISTKLLAQAGHDQSEAWWTALLAELGYTLLWLDLGQNAMTCIGEVDDVLADEEWESVFALAVEAGVDDALLQCVVDHNASIESLAEAHVVWQPLDLGDATKVIRAFASSSKGYSLAAGTDGLLLLADASNTIWVEASLASNDDLYAACHAGAQGAVLVLAGAPAVVWRSTDNGATWPAAADTAAIIDDILGLSRSDGVDDIVVGVGAGGGIYRSTDAGDSWSSVASPTSEILRAVTRCAGALVACGDDGTIIRSTDGGANWTSIDVGTYPPLHGAGAWGALVVLCGDDGTIVRSIDGGATWALVTAPVTTHLRAVHRSPSGRWCAAGIGGVVLQSLDDGVTWEQRSVTTTSDLLAAGSDWPLGRAFIGGDDRTLLVE